MKRNLKALGLAVVAAFAMSAVAASAASAENQFKADDYPVVLTGHEEGEVNRFNVGNSSLECDSTTFEGTAEEDSTSLTITPHYDDCKTSAGTSAKVHLNGCDFEFTAGEHVGTHEFEGDAHIRCPSEQSITLTIPESGSLCVIHIGEQTVRQDGEHSLTFTNNTNGGGTADDDVTVDVDVTVTANVTKESIFCPLSGGVTNEATYESKVTVKGFGDEGTTAHPSTSGKDAFAHDNTQVGVRVSTP